MVWTFNKTNETEEMCWGLEKLSKTKEFKVLQ